MPPPPSITSISPRTGIANTILTIYGTNFLNNPAPTVTIGGMEVTQVTYISSTELRCIVPVKIVPGIIFLIQIFNNDDQSFDDYTNQNLRFRYVEGLTIITSFTPNNGTVNTLITINGTNFLNNPPPIVKIGGINASQVTFISSTKLTCIAPANNPGNYTIEIINNDTQHFTTTDVFTYNQPSSSPIINSFTPKNGTVDTLITINGTNFLNNPPPIVKIGGVNATQVTFISSTQITCVAPTNNLGNYTIEVINNNNQNLTTTDVFTYIPINIILTTSIISSSTIIFADGITSATVQVTAINSSDNSQVNNLFINLTSSTTTSIITPTNNQTTDANGQMTFTVTDTTIGNTTFTASVGNISSQISIKFNSNLVNTFIINSTNLLADGTLYTIYYIGYPNVSVHIESTSQSSMGVTQQMHYVILLELQHFK